MRRPGTALFSTFPLQHYMKSHLARLLKQVTPPGVQRNSLITVSGATPAWMKAFRLQAKCLVLERTGSLIQLFIPRIDEKKMLAASLNNNGSSRLWRRPLRGFSGRGRSCGAG